MKKFIGILIFLAIFVGGIVYSGSAQASTPGSVTTQVCKLIKVKKHVYKNSCTGKKVVRHSSRR